jgi:Tfp pilus assembly protein PilF
MGQKEFYVVRADVYRLKDQPEAAFADYDRAIAEHVFKLRSFLAAGDLALERHDNSRATRYFEWAVHCRPDSQAARDGLARSAKAVVK